MKYTLNNYLYKAEAFLTDEQVVSLICMNGSLPSCCGEVSALRDGIIEITRKGYICEHNFAYLCNKTNLIKEDHAVPDFWIEFLNGIKEKNFFQDERF